MSIWKKAQKKGREIKRKRERKGRKSKKGTVDELTTNQRLSGSDELATRPNDGITHRYRSGPISKCSNRLEGI